MIDILSVCKPKLVGPKMNVRAYLAWKQYHQQLWRFTEYIGEPTNFKPIEIEQPVEHKTRPRYRDTIMVRGRFGIILWPNSEFNEVRVRHFTDNGYEDETYELDCVESNRGKIRWRIE